MFFLFVFLFQVCPYDSWNSIFNTTVTHWTSAGLHLVNRLVDRNRVEKCKAYWIYRLGRNFTLNPEFENISRKKLAVKFSPTGVLKGNKILSGKTAHI